MTESVSTLALALLQILFVFGLSPLLIGIMRKVKARMQGRSGSSIFQPYIDVLKLLSKGSAKSDVTSFVFFIAPVIGFASIAIAALMLPILAPMPMLAVSIIIFAYLFSIGRFLTALSGLDAGSAFGGMGSSREMLYSVLIEPALFAVILFLVAFGSTGAISSLASNNASWFVFVSSPQFWLAALALFVIVLAETGRLPFDNPATHLELTMVHEAMILENSGPGLALIEWAQASKIFLFFTLMAVLFLPLNLVDSMPMRALCVFIAVVVISVITAAVESISVKVRLFKVAELLVFAMVLAILAFLTNIFGFGSESLATSLVLVMLLSSLYFIFSATFRRRLEIYVLQSLCLALIFLIPLVATGTPGSYFEFATTVVFKLILIPLLFYHLFRTMPGEVKLLSTRFYRIFQATKDNLRMDLDFDPLFVSGSVSTARTLIYAGILILLSFALSFAFGVHNLMLPLVLSLILIGMLIIAVKSHLLLQLLGFLLMENGVVLLPTALSIDIPIMGEIVSMFDVLVLIIVAVLLAIKIRGTLGTMDTKQLDELIEKR